MLTHDLLGRISPNRALGEKIRKLETERAAMLELPLPLLRRTEISVLPPFKIPNIYPPVLQARRRRWWIVYAGAGI